ncbi:MAG: family 2 glycosyl transferase [Bacteroidetes bacterium]|nr:MAG: family 2 glycosyl transferase [Bacteroidota bacterium]
MNDRIPEKPPVIAPLPNVANRPQWSVMIPSYNCSRFLEDAIRSVLLQDKGPDNMQIEVVDDASTDANVEELVRRVGKGRVKFYRQEKNIGSLRNFETCLNRSRGNWIHILHGDDMVKPGFYDEIDKLFKQYPEAGAAFTAFTHVGTDGNFLYNSNPIQSEPGIIKDWLYEIARSQKIQPPAIVVKRSVYEELGGFFAVHYGEDWEMWVRIAAHFPVAHSPKKLAMYRIHSDNITSQSFITGQSIDDIKKVIDIIQDYLPTQDRKSLKHYAMQHFSKYFARMSDRVYHEYKMPDIAMKQAKRAANMNLNKITAFFVLKIYIKKMIGY